MGGAKNTMFVRGGKAERYNVGFAIGPKSKPTKPTVGKFHHEYCFHKERNGIQGKERRGFAGGSAVRVGDEQARKPNGQAYLSFL